MEFGCYFSVIFADRLRMAIMILFSLCDAFYQVLVFYGVMDV